jgi:hypothetical protein
MSELAHAANNKIPITNLPNDWKLSVVTLYMEIKLYNIKGNNIIAGIYFTYLFFLNNKCNMKVIIIVVMDIKTNTITKFINTPPSLFVSD